MPVPGGVRLCALAALLPVVLAPALGAGADDQSSRVVVRTRRGVAAAAVSGGRLAMSPVFEGGFAHPGLARRLGLDRCFRVVVPEGDDTGRLAAELRGLEALVEMAEPDAIGGVAETIPTDPGFGVQWGLLNTVGADINVTPAWDRETGDDSVIIAVLDAGMDPHVELSGRLVAGRNVAAQPDNNDWSDVCISHGTHVAGIAAATANNGIGIAGVNWGCRIMPVRVLNSCSGPESFAAEGVVWAADHGADVINMSLQYYTGGSALRGAVQYAEALGVVVVAASGNLDGPVAYPAAWPETIAVGAIGDDGQRWAQSNRGPQLDVMAPGVSVYSLLDTSQYQYLTGTSMAAPHASGVVALLESIDPALTPAGARQVLRETAADLDAEGFDELTGFGLIDAGAAVAAVEPLAGDLDLDGDVDVNDFLALLAVWGPCAGPCGCAGDLDGDCAVGVDDFLMLLANWTG